MFEQFKTLLIDEFQVDESKITLDAELSGDLAINSIELAELILRCEEEFGIDIQEEEMHKFVTVGDVVEYLNTLGNNLRSDTVTGNDSYFMFQHSVHS